MFTQQKILIILNKGKTKPKTPEIAETLEAEIKKGWRVVTTITAPDGIVVVLEGERKPTDHAMLPVF